MKVDLNCDLGENCGRDEEILNYITSANIACGFHAGDSVTMERTVKIALDKGVKIGVHPGLPDLENFGRKIMKISDKEARSFMIYQIGALYGFVKALGGKLNHVKPHGALYNMAAKDYKFSKILAEAVYDVDPELIFVGLSNSLMVEAARDTGLAVLNEVFADRAYNNDGTLVSRTLKGAVLHDVNHCTDRVTKMIKENKVISIDGNEINIKADTVCLHGDNEEALQLAKSIYSKFF